MSVSPIRLAVLASHPIQYFTPLYKLLAAEPGVEMEVMYYRDFGVTQRFDKQFGRAIQWDTDLLGGYRHRFLTNISPISDTFRPMHAVNPGAFFRLLHGFDAVWLNGYTYPSNWLALAAASLRGLPLLLRSELRLDDRAVTTAKARLREAVVRGWMRRADALLYIGTRNREAYLHYGATPEKLFFSPYSADVDGIGAVVSSASRSALRAARGIPADAVVVACVGKLTSHKHPDALLRVAADPAIASRVHVVFAGSGPEEGALRAECERMGLRNVTFLGFVNQSALPEVYALSDVFAFPSERETWGLVLNEAMAAGLAPVVASDVGATADLITQGETGFIFPKRDWDAMLAAIRPLVEDAALRARVASAARRRASAFSHRASVQGVVDALHAVVRPRPRGSARLAAAP
jgi:glycosyltransferase involved in cell wall biosynthesis